MSLRSSLLAGGAALLLLVVLGNPVTFDFIRDDAPSWARFTAFEVAFTYNLGLDDDFVETGPALLRAVVIVAVAFVLGGMAGRARPLAALVGGWGAAYGALALGSIAFVLAADDRFIGRSPSPRFIDKVTAAATSAGGVAFWTGWVIALAVLLGRDRRVVVAPKAAPLGSPTPDGAPGYGVPGYGAPGYGAPGYGAPGYGAPAGTPGPAGPFGATPAPGAPATAADPSPFASPTEPPTERHDAVPSTPAPAAAPPVEVEPPTAPQEPVASTTPPPPPAPPGDGPVIGPPPERS